MLLSSSLLENPVIVLVRVKKGAIIIPDAVQEIQAVLVKYGLHDVHAEVITIEADWRNSYQDDPDAPPDSPDLPPASPSVLLPESEQTQGRGAQVAGNQDNGPEDEKAPGANTSAEIIYTESTLYEFNSHMAVCRLIPCG